MPQPTPAARQVMLGELIDLVSGSAMGEQGDKAKDILGRVCEYFLLHYARMERLSNETLPVHNGATLSERGAPVSYRYSFEDLLALLHGHAPAKVDAVALHRRRVDVWCSTMQTGTSTEILIGGRKSLAPTIHACCPNSQLWPIFSSTDEISQHHQS
jgi:hypothetical protein